MPKVVEIVVPAGQTNELVSDVQKLPGLIGLKVQTGVSVQPPGDVIEVTLANAHLASLLEVLDQRKVGGDQDSSFSTSEPVSTVSASSRDLITRDTNESAWEEMEVEMGRQSNTTVYTLSLMAISGGLAATGLATDTLHYVLAAMLLAPGFLPITRIAMGISLRNASWQRGLADLLKAYAVMVVAAGLVTLVIMALGEPVYDGDPAYLPRAGILFSYWQKINATTILVTLLAGVAGGITVITHRTVLSMGVMIALGLVPAATFIGAGAVTGQWELVSTGLLRWLLEVGIVLLVSLGVFALYRSIRHKRGSRL